MDRVVSQSEMSNDWYLHHPFVQDVFCNNKTVYENVAKWDLSVCAIGPKLLKDDDIVKTLALGVMAHREEQHNIIRFICRRDPKWREVQKVC